MRPIGLIPGEGYGSPPHAQAPPARGSTAIRIVIALWLIGGLVILGLKLFWSKADAPVAPAPASNQATSDVVRRLASANRRLTDAAAKIHRAEDEIDRTIPSLDQNYLLVESRRLKNAAAVADDARRSLEQCREEFETILNAQRKDNHQ